MTGGHLHYDVHRRAPVQKKQQQDLDATARLLVQLIDKFEEKVVKQLRPEEQDAQLFPRLKQNLALAIEYAPSRDFEDIPCNGVRTLIRHSLTYLQIADKKKKEADVRSFLSVVRVMDVWFRLIAYAVDIKSISEFSKFCNPLLT